MPETEKSHPSSKRGRRPFNPTAKHRDRVALFGGWWHPAAGDRGKRRCNRVHELQG
jgi:hypothetical protein